MWCCFSMYHSTILRPPELCDGTIGILLWLVAPPTITKWKPFHQVLEGLSKLNNLAWQPSSNMTHERMGKLWCGIEETLIDMLLVQCIQEYLIGFKKNWCHLSKILFFERGLVIRLERKEHVIPFFKRMLKLMFIGMLLHTILIQNQNIFKCSIVVSVLSVIHFLNLGSP